MNNLLEVYENAQIEATTIRSLAETLHMLSGEGLNSHTKEIRERIKSRMLALLPSEETVPIAVAGIISILTDPENQPHQFVGREDLLTKLLVIPVRHVLNTWKEAQVSIMTKEMKQLIEEIEQALGNQDA